MIKIGVTTCGSKKEARELVASLLKKRLIACGQVEGPIISMYTWSGKLRKDQEYRITVKFRKENDSNLRQAIKQIHSYEVPQWVSWDANGSEEYEKWVIQSCKK